MMLCHASAVAIDGAAILLRGGSGAGKSDLALRLIEAGAVLIGDDYVELSRGSGQLLASPPDRLKGLLEVRGVGLLRFPFESGVPVALCLDLVGRNDVERLPEEKETVIEGVSLPVLAFHAFEASAASKARLALSHFGRGSNREGRHDPV